MRIGPDAFTVIGVAPAGFTGDTPEAVDAWAPLFTAARELPSTWTTSPMFRSVMVLTRLADGAQPQTVATEAATAYRRTSEGTAAADETARVVSGLAVTGPRLAGTADRSGSDRTLARRRGPAGAAGRDRQRCQPADVACRRAAPRAGRARRAWSGARAAVLDAGAGDVRDRRWRRRAWRAADVVERHRRSIGC